MEMTVLIAKMNKTDRGDVHGSDIEKSKVMVVNERDSVNRTEIKCNWKEMEVASI